jgi:hypothetical protein
MANMKLMAKASKAGKWSATKRNNKVTSSTLGRNANPTWAARIVAAKAEMRTIRFTGFNP